jgi:hypothetical protein
LLWLWDFVWDFVLVPSSADELSDPIPVHRLFGKEAEMFGVGRADLEGEVTVADRARIGEVLPPVPGSSRGSVTGVATLPRGK